MLNSMIQTWTLVPSCMVIMAGGLEGPLMWHRENPQVAGTIVMLKGEWTLTVQRRKEIGNVILETIMKVLIQEVMINIPVVPGQ